MSTEDAVNLFPGRRNKKKNSKTKSGIDGMSEFEKREGQRFNRTILQL
jgi:hypothetical protein